MKKKLFAVGLGIENALKNGTHLCLITTHVWDKGMVELRTADDVNEQIHEILGAIPTAEEIEALADGNGGMLLDDGFIDKLNALARRLRALRKKGANKCT